MDVYLARQPIYDRQLQVIAYELLYRSGDTLEAGAIDDPEGASSQVIVNTFMEVGFDQITGGVPAFINVTREFLISDGFPSKFRDRLVPELLEDTLIDDTLVQAAKRLAKSGYQLALDDFVAKPEWMPLIEVADIIKLDVLHLKEEGVREQLQLLKNCKAKLLAEKVETHEEYELYRSMGFDYFQGYFFAKPKIIKEKGIPASKMVIARLLAELNREDADIDRIEKLVCQDARLTYKLLKIVNSAFFGLPRKVNSIPEALVLLGLNELKCWAAILSLSAVDDKPNELLLTAMVRGKMCQILAEKLNMHDPGKYFTAGLFSLLDALMDVHLEDIIEQMPFSEDLVRAVLCHEGEIGIVLHTVIAYEKGEWGEVHLGSLDREQIWDSYLQALDWSGVAKHAVYSD